MFTVTCCLLWSGNSRNRSPFSSWYSVIPSTEATLVTPSGRSCAANGSATARQARTQRVRLRTSFVVRFIVLLLRGWRNQLGVFTPRTYGL